MSIRPVRQRAVAVSYNPNTEHDPLSSVPETPKPATEEGEVTTPRQQADWLLAKTKESIKHMENMRLRFQKLAGTIRVVTLLLSGVITVTLGIRWSEYADDLRNIAFVVGAISTTVASLDLYFNYRGLWIEHEEAEWRLHRLHDRIDFYLQGRDDEQLSATTIADFHEAYQWIWDNLSKSWLSLRRSTDTR